MIEGDGTQTIGRIIQNSDVSFTVVGDNNSQLLVLVMDPNSGCYENPVELGTTDPILGRINWAPVSSQFVTPAYTDIALSRRGWGGF